MSSFVTNVKFSYTCNVMWYLSCFLTLFMFGHTCYNLQHFVKICTYCHTCHFLHIWHVLSHLSCIDLDVIDRKTEIFKIDWSIWFYLLWSKKSEFYFRFVSYLKADLDLGSECSFDFISILIYFWKLIMTFSKNRRKYVYSIVSLLVWYIIHFG